MTALLQVDQQITLTLYHWGNAHPTAQHFFLLLAVVAVYSLPLILIWLFWRNQGEDRLNSAKIFLAAVLSWQVFSKLIGTWLYASYGFRDRPFSLDGLQEFFLEQPQKAFPSDHAAVLAAVTTTFFIYKYPKLGWLFVVLAVLTAAGRVVVGFHYIGDVAGGAVVGVLTALLIRAADKPLDKLALKLRIKK